MKRFIVPLVVGTLVLATSASPALAGNSGTEGGPPLFSGHLGKTLVFHCHARGGKSVAIFFAKRDEVRGNCR